MNILYPTWQILWFSLKLFHPYNDQYQVEKLPIWSETASSKMSTEHEVQSKLLSFFIDF